MSFEQPPAFTELIDSAAVHADLIRQWSDVEDSGAPVGQALFTIHVDSIGDVTWIDVISADLADDDVAFVSSLFRGRVKAHTTETEYGPRRQSWIYRIGVGIDRAFTFKVRQPVYCLPRVRNEHQIGARLTDLLNSQDATVSGPSQSTVLWILPGEAGGARRIEVTRSSGSARLDQIAQHAAAAGHFERATADGHPLDHVWISFPITFRPESRRQQR